MKQNYQVQRVILKYVDAHIGLMLILAKVTC